MKACILFSGGKDSCLVALMLSKFFDVELITCGFGVLSNWERAEEAAKKIGFPFRILKLDSKILENAAEQTVEDGFPNNGIKYIHQIALEKTAEDFKIISDGVRRDDRVPVLSFPEIQRFEDKFNIHYVQPLAGFSKKIIDILVEKHFKIKEYKSDNFIGAEYEFELKEFIRKNYDPKLISKIFPKNHTHSIVLAANS